MPTLLVRVCLFIGVIARAAAAFGGVAYDVTVTRTADGGGKQTYTVVADDGYILATQTEVPPGEPVTHDSVLWTGKAPAIALNSQNETWYELTPDTPGAHGTIVTSVTTTGPFALASRFLKPVYKGTLKNVTVQLNAPSVVGSERHYTGRIAYDVHSSSGRVHVKVTCTATFDVITTDKVDRRHWLGQILPITSVDAVDARIGAAEASIEGFPVRLSLTATRRYEGGQPMQDVVEVQVSGIREVTPAITTFTRPRSYRHQKPVLAVPGREGY